MSDHAWVQEHVAAYLAGGLDAQEAERLEAHARECPACAAALASSRRLDDCLSNLFVGVHPRAGLEDRAVAQLRTAPPRWPVFNPRVKWAVAAVAAVLLLGVIGAVAGSVASGESLRMPGSAERESARAPQKASAKIVRSYAGASREPGLDSNLEAALPEIDRLNHRNDGRAPIMPPREGQTRELNGVQTDLVRGSMMGYDFGLPAAPITEDTTALAPPGLTPDVTPWNGVGPFAATTFPGRSGATKSHLLRPGSDHFDPAKARLNDGYTTFDSELKKAKSDEEVRQAATKTSLDDLLPQPKLAARQPDPDKPNPKAQPADPIKVDPNPEPLRRIIIRSGDMEFEIESFDSATATVTKLVLAIKGAFVATINSDKLTNGKVKGSITVRVPPDQLDGLVLDLRRELGKGGELKGVKLASQDVTKMYTDMESRLKAARTMETRLLQIIKEGKGEIKQLLEAEKELGLWRTKIEETEGEIRYYANLAAFSTLTISLTEKEIRAAATITERERVQAGVEVEDVDKAYQQVLAAVLEVKGRITKSELKQLSAGQFNATFVFEVSAESGGPIRDRLRMLGRVARLEIDRSVSTEGGTLPSDAKAKRGDTVFLVQLYNLANVAPREAVTLQLAATDVPTAYQALRDAAAKTTGRVLVSQLNEQDRQNITAQFDFEVRRTEEGAVRAAVDAAGEVLSRQVGRAAESDSVTDSKVLYRVTLLSASRLKPREVMTLSVEVADVDGSATQFATQVAEAKGRQVDAKLDRDAQGQATAKLVFEVPLSAAATLVERFKAAGKGRVLQSVRDPQATEGKYATARIHVTLTNVEAIVPEGGGLWPKVREGLSISASVLLRSVTWVVSGLCVVLPWAVIGYGGYRVVRRFMRPAPAAPAATPTPDPTAPPPASA